jgi:hypothetical protein
MFRNRWTIVALVAVWFSYPCDAMAVWKLEQSPDAPSHRHMLRLDFQALSDYLLLPPTALRGLDEGLLEFDLPNGLGMHKCVLAESKLMDAELQAKHPSIMVRTGKCGGEVDMHFSLQQGKPESFSATFTIPNKYMDWFYVDYAGDGRYVMYAKSTAVRRGAEPFNCTTEHAHGKHEAHTHHHGRGLAERGPLVSATLRIAVAARRDYAEATGDTIDSTMHAIVITMSRVNGVYLQELGIFFQLVGTNDRLLCVAGRLEYCAMLNSFSLIDQFMTRRGVADSTFDIGHVFTAETGGVALLASLCIPKFKAWGMSGLSQPIGDPFSV